jgi:hypothetical protein
MGLGHVLSVRMLSVAGRRAITGSHIAFPKRRKGPEGPFLFGVISAQKANAPQPSGVGCANEARFTSMFSSAFFRASCWLRRVMPVRT